MMPAIDGNFSGRLRGLHLPNSLSEKAGTPCGVPALRCMAMLGVLKKNMLNIVLFIILGALWWGACRKEHFRRWVEYLLLIPIAYGLGHLCVLGFRTVSYSEWRDFQLILAIGVLLYCAMLLALNIFYAGKDFLNMHRKDHR